jgi:hypothetical protein
MNGNGMQAVCEAAITRPNQETVLRLLLILGQQSLAKNELSLAQLLVDRRLEVIVVPGDVVMIHFHFRLKLICDCASGFLKCCPFNINLTIIMYYTLFISWRFSNLLMSKPFRKTSFFFVF